MTLRTVLLSLQALLAAAEPDDPQDAVVANQVRKTIPSLSSVPELHRLRKQKAVGTTKTFKSSFKHLSVSKLLRWFYSVSTLFADVILYFLFWILSTSRTQKCSNRLLGCGRTSTPALPSPVLTTHEK